MGAKLMALGTRPKILPEVVKVPVKPAMAACRGARAAGGVAAVIVVPAPTVRIVLVGLLIVLLPTGLPWRLKVTARALASLGASAIEAPTAAANRGRSLVVFIRDRVAINAVVQRQVSSRFAVVGNLARAGGETV